MLFLIFLALFYLCVFCRNKPLRYLGWGIYVPLLLIAFGTGGGGATNSAEATKTINDLRNLKGAYNLYERENSRWLAPGEEISLDQYTDRPIVSTDIQRYRRVEISGEITDETGTASQYIGVELNPQNGTKGIKKKLVQKAVDAGIYNAVPGESEAPAPYSGGDTVWVRAR
ncbi:MAG: hypothetical protein LBL05_09415 [Synergistaceae bacterium]|jgi:hypothetical protein|nr:hypothetical protein [Synergistaceae bacterium]